MYGKKKSKKKDEYTKKKDAKKIKAGGTGNGMSKGSY